MTLWLGDDRRRDPLSWALIATTALAFVVPLVVWTNDSLPGRSWFVLLFALSVPGLAVSTAVFGRWRTIWLGMAPVVSVATVLVVTTALTRLNASWPGLPLSIGALVHALALPRAWRSATPVGRPTDARPTPSGVRSRVTRLAGFVPLVVAVALWRSAVTRIDLDRADAFGILRVAPWQYWACLVAVTFALAVALRPAFDRVLAAASLATFALVTFGFVGAVDGTPSVPTSFLHIGVVDAISTLGFVPTQIDARFSWPGYFVSAATLQRGAGVTNLVTMATWYPVVAAILAVPPMLAFARAVSGDERTAWTAAYVLMCASWVQQDYFSPQSLAFLILLNVLAVFAGELADGGVPPTSGAWWRRIAQLPLRTPDRVAGWGWRRTVAVEFVLLGLTTATVIGHQLTPMAVIAVTAGLSAVGLTRHRTLWLATAAVFVAWFAFGATDWWTGHLGGLLREVGQVQQSITSGALKRVAGDPWYSRMQLGRIAWSAFLGGMAAIGWWTRRRTWVGPFAIALVAAPTILVGTQSYGGEVILRVFLYASPTLAALAGIAIMAVVPRLPGPEVLVTVPGFAALAVGFVVTRNVNVAFERTPPDVQRAALEVLDTAPWRAKISPLRAEAVIQQRRYREVDSPDDIGCQRTPLECILRQRPEIVFLTRTRDLFDQLRSGSIPGYSRSLAHQLTASGQYRVDIDTTNVVVLRRVDLDDGGAS